MHLFVHAFAHSLVGSFIHSLVGCDAYIFGNDHEPDLENEPDLEHELDLGILNTDRIVILNITIITHITRVSRVELMR